MNDTLNQPFVANGVGTWLESVGRFLTRIGVGLVLLVAVGAAIVATTFIGLFLAGVAAIFALSQGLRRSATRKGSTNTDPEGDITLEAHSTPDGWVTEVPPRR